MKKKKTGAFCLSLVGVLLLGMVTVAVRSATLPVHAVDTPCGEVDTSGVLDDIGVIGDGTSSDTVTGVGSSIGLGTDIAVGVVSLAGELRATGDLNWTTADEDVVLSIDYRNLTCIEIWENGTLITRFAVTPSNDWQNAQRVVQLLAFGRNTITVRGFDLFGSPLEEDLVFSIILDLGVPDTGVIQIGDLTIGRVDLITIISSLVVACGIFVILATLNRKKQDARATARRRR